MRATIVASFTMVVDNPPFVEDIPDVEHATRAAKPAPIIAPRSC